MQRPPPAAPILLRWENWSGTIGMEREGPPAPNSSYHMRLGALFERALAVPHGRRGAFVADACRADVALGEDLISLLEAHETAPEHFERLSADVVTPMLSAIARRFEDAVDPDIADRLGTALAGTYRLERELGGGGMSRVFVAEDLELKRRVVIKVLPPEMAPADSERRFRREIELAARLQHPLIVPLLTTDSRDGLLYYTMPFISGETLGERLAREGALPVDEAVQIWHDVLDALAHAHASGVIHLDVKPGNILLNGRHALVTDFGISRAVATIAGDAWAPRRGPVFGTPAYMAPEEAAADGRADHRADLYAAGIVMYEMLTGKPPFAPTSAREILVSHATREPAPLIRPQVPRRLVRLVMRCLERDPSARPQSADDILTEVDATAVPVGHRAKRHPASVRRRRLGLYASLALASSALLFAVPRLPRATSDPRDAASAPGIAAYEWYRRGMDVALLRTDSGRLKGVDYFEQAIAIDPDFVDAYAGLARMYLQLANAAAGSTRRDWLERAEWAAGTAVALDGRDADALAARGWVHLMSGRYAAAEADLELGIAMDPGVPRVHEGLARVYMMTGRPLDELREARLGVEADPFSHSAIRELALALAANGRCEESLEQLLPLKTLSPPAGVAGLLIGQCLASKRMWPEAIAEFRWAADHSATAGLAFVGYGLARAGRRDSARAILSDLETGREYSHGAFGIAIVHAGLGDRDQAFRWLERAADEQTMSLYVMHPLFRELHDDPRFDGLMRRIGVGSP